MSRYAVYVVPDEFRSIKRLPGNVRQRVTRAIDELADNPRPPHSKQLEIAELEGPPGEVRRLRIDNWRVVYLVSDDEKTVDVVAVRKRPPYDYGDLAQLLGG
jgi:mRNA interferase RelE/StbE